MDHSGPGDGGSQGLKKCKEFRPRRRELTHVEYVLGGAWGVCGSGVSVWVGV